MKTRLMKKILALIFLISFLVLPNISLADCPTGNGPVCLNLNYPAFTIGSETYDLNTQQDLNQIVAWFYYFIIGVAGLAAFVMLVMGGVKYLTSAGSPSAISDAKDQIKSALLGLLIILMSWLILQVINPDLTVLGPVEL